MFMVLLVPDHWWLLYRQLSANLAGIVLAVELVTLEGISFLHFDLILHTKPAKIYITHTTSNNLPYHRSLLTKSVLVPL